MHDPRDGSVLTKLDYVPDILVVDKQLGQVLDSLKKHNGRPAVWLDKLDRTNNAVIAVILDDLSIETIAVPIAEAAAHRARRPTPNPGSAAERAISSSNNFLVEANVVHADAATRQLTKAGTPKSARRIEKEAAVERREFVLHRTHELAVTVQGRLLERVGQEGGSFLPVGARSFAKSIAEACINGTLGSTFDWTKLYIPKAADAKKKDSSIAKDDKSAMAIAAALPGIEFILEELFSDDKTIPQLFKKLRGVMTAADSAGCSTKDMIEGLLSPLLKRFSEDWEFFHSGSERSKLGKIWERIVSADGGDPIVRSFIDAYGPGAKAGGSSAKEIADLKKLVDSLTEKVTATEQKNKNLNERCSRLEHVCKTRFKEMGVETDPNFSNDELSRTWSRTGKGKKRWSPGDATGDTALDTRLLYSSWVLNPLRLHVREGCSQSTAARLVLGWLDLPFKVVADGEGGDRLPRLEGEGVPNKCIESFGEIASFACGVAKPDKKCVAPATNREDIQEWLANPTSSGLEGLFRGRQAENGVPCLNAWGLSLDDAVVLPVAKVLGSCAGDDEAEECSLDIMEYIMFNFAKAGIDEP